jgi:polysaccharide export outer membrane protein
MNGTGSYGVNMLKKLTLLSSFILLSSCDVNVMPGMQNLNTTSMRKSVVHERVHVEPTLVPISPSLIADQRVSTYYYHVAPADVLHITVWQHPEFQVDAQLVTAMTPGVQGAAGQPGYLVNASGKIYFPLVGYVHVAGKTVDEIRANISKRLETYVLNPQVNVRVADFRGQKVYVLGEVVKTGFLPITDQSLTIADALALSGWIDSKAADPSNIYVIRGDYTKPQIFWLDARTPDKLLLAERFSLQPRDILYVSAAPIAQLNRALDQLLPIVQTVWFTQSIVKNS